MEEEILLYKGGLKTVELLICEAADRLGHQDDFQNNKWWTDYNFKSNKEPTVLPLQKLRNADLKLLKRKKRKKKKAQKVSLLVELLTIFKGKHLVYSKINTDNKNILSNAKDVLKLHFSKQSFI